MVCRTIAQASSADEHTDVFSFVTWKKQIRDLVDKLHGKTHFRVRFPATNEPAFLTRARIRIIAESVTPPKNDALAEVAEKMRKKAASLGHFGGDGQAEAKLKAIAKLFGKVVRTACKLYPRKKDAAADPYKDCLWTIYLQHNFEHYTEMMKEAFKGVPSKVKTQIASTNCSLQDVFFKLRFLAEELEKSTRTPETLEKLAQLKNKCNWAAHHPDSIHTVRRLLLRTKLKLEKQSEENRSEEEQSPELSLEDAAQESHLVHTCVNDEHIEATKNLFCECIAMLKTSTPKQSNATRKKKKYNAEKYIKKRRTNVKNKNKNPECCSDSE
ncbi:hypothetical protein DIPPA_55844, partial [Diplonema papillatum]